MTMRFILIYRNSSLKQKDKIDSDLSKDVVEIIYDIIKKVLVSILKSK